MTALALPKIDGATVATLALEEQEPWPPERTREGRAIGKRSRAIWRNADGSLGAGIWEVDEGTFWADFRAYGEIIFVVAGEMECTADADGSVVTLRAGDAMVFPRGWTGWWAIKVRLRKIYSAWEYD
jgi:uncharacterized cupin superfamily protein